MQDVDPKEATAAEPTWHSIGSKPEVIHRHSGGWATPPNVVSLIRVAMAPVVGWLILVDQPLWAFWVFLVAGLSDGLDGGLARWLDMRSDLGSILDPAADKALLGIAFVALGLQGAIPLWLVVIVIGRDVGLVLVTLVQYIRARAVRGLSPARMSKINTVLQIVLVASTLAATAFGLALGLAGHVLVWATALMTIVSSAGYLVRLMRSAAKDRRLA